MKLEDQVCSLELAKRLKELGAKQESLFYWSRPWPLGSEWITDGGSEYRITDTSNPDSISAFSASELGEILPNDLFPFGERGKMQGFVLQFIKGYGDWFYFYQEALGSKRYWHDEVTSYHKRGVIAETEVDARAKMMIYLFENKLVKP